MKRPMFTVGLVLVLLGADGCSKDTDCKGERVCEQGVCVNPTYVPQSQREGLVPAREKEIERPVFEPGFAVFEFAVGALTSAAITVPPYLTLFSNGQLDQSLGTPLFVINSLVSAAASAGFQILASLGSRYWRSYAVAPFAAGILGMGAVLGIYYLTGWLPSGRFTSGGVPAQGGSVAFLMIGKIAVVPLLQTAALNIFKIPREPQPQSRIAVVPSIAPLLSANGVGAQLGLSGSF